MGIGQGAATVTLGLSWGLVRWRSSHRGLLRVLGRGGVRNVVGYHGGWTKDGAHHVVDYYGDWAETVTLGGCLGGLGRSTPVKSGVIAWIRRGDGARHVGGYRVDWTMIELSRSRTVTGVGGGGGVTTVTSGVMVWLGRGMVGLRWILSQGSVGGRYPSLRVLSCGGGGRGGTRHIGDYHVGWVGNGTRHVVGCHEGWTGNIGVYRVVCMGNRVRHVVGCHGDWTDDRDIGGYRVGWGVGWEGPRVCCVIEYRRDCAVGDGRHVGVYHGDWGRSVSVTSGTL